MGCRASVLVAVTLLWAGSAGAQPSSSHATPSTEATDFDGLMTQAEQQRNDGDHAAAARSYAAAYRALSETEQRGLKGELAVDNALAEYRAARDQQPGDLDLPRELLGLLDAFIDARTQAHAAGRAEDVPPRLEEERTRLEEDERARRDERLQDAQDEKDEEPLPAPDPVVPAPQAETMVPDEAPAPRTDPEPEPEPQPEDSASRGADTAILMGGAVALVGGSALVGGGAWNFVMTDRRARARLQALEDGEFTELAREEFRAELSAWQDQWRGKATALVVAGSVLAATGIGLTTWGAVRMRKDGRASTRRVRMVVPVSSRERVGIVVRLGF